MVSDALNNNMLENKYTTATAVPAFNRVWLRPPRNRYMISISWVPKWKINQVTIWVQCGRNGWVGVEGVLHGVMCVAV